MNKRKRENVEVVSVIIKTNSILFQLIPIWKHYFLQPLVCPESITCDGATPGKSRSPVRGYKCVASRERGSRTLASCTSASCSSRIVSSVLPRHRARSRICLTTEQRTRWPCDIRSAMKIAGIMMFRCNVPKVACLSLSAQTLSRHQYPRESQ